VVAFWTIRDLVLILFFFLCVYALYSFIRGPFIMSMVCMGVATWSCVIDFFAWSHNLRFWEMVQSSKRKGGQEEGLI